MRIRTYRELIKMDSYKERYEYLRLSGSVGEDTFGFDRWLNQRFYRSGEWRRIRKPCIARDLACDMAVPGYEIHGPVYVHHMNPLTKQQILDGVEDMLSPEFLVCVSLDTHNAIHYGNEEQIIQDYVERKPGDTRFW